MNQRNCQNQIGETKNASIDALRLLKKIAAWQIDSREKLLTEMDKDPDGVLTMILDMRTIYTEYLNQTNVHSLKVTLIQAQKTANKSE